MHPDKAPGPDGMTVCFYKKYWSIVGQDVIRVVKVFFKRDDHLRSINHTNLVLIPKKRLPTSPKDYRPISLCNVIYKIISKVIANRLKQLLPKVINESQSAFIQGRMITDNIMITHESVHYIKKGVSGRVGYLACKLECRKLTTE